MTLPIFLGLFCGALWGFSFLSPKLVSESASAFALARYTLGGLVAVVFLFLNFRLLKNLFLKRHDLILKAFVLASIGYTFFYWSLVSAVKLIGVSYPSLIVGLLPVSIAVFGREGQKFKPKAWVALALIFLGIVSINVDAFFTVGNWAGVPVLQRVFGFLLATTSLGLWTVFAIYNARLLKKTPELSGMLWSSLLSLCAAIVMSMLTFTFDRDGAQFVWRSLVTLDVQTTFWFWAFVTGVFGSWFATWLWNYSTRRIPTSLSGQLIVSETVFALIYGFIHEARLPQGFEALAIGLLVVGVSLAIKAFKL